jgi:hypothetical protein
MNHFYRVNLKSLPAAMREGALFLVNPKSGWAHVGLRPADLRALWLDYALWWVLLAALLRGALALYLGRALQGDEGLSWLAVLSDTVVLLVAGLCGVLVLALLARVFASSLGAAQPLWDDGMRLAAYGLTPAWLAFALWRLPLVGDAVMLAGVAYSAFCVWLGLGYVLGVPLQQRTAFMWRFGAAAAAVCLVAAALQLALLAMLVVLLVAWLQIDKKMKSTVEAANDAASNMASGMDSDTVDDAQSDDVPAKAAMKAVIAQQAVADVKAVLRGVKFVDLTNAAALSAAVETMKTAMKPVLEQQALDAAAEVAADADVDSELDSQWDEDEDEDALSDEESQLLATVQRKQEPSPVNAEKMAALDKKIAKAIAKGDMAEMARLLGEQQMLRIDAGKADNDF